jgi:hypothetical protein
MTSIDPIVLRPPDPPKHKGGNPGAFIFKFFKTPPGQQLTPAKRYDKHCLFCDEVIEAARKEALTRHISILCKKAPPEAKEQAVKASLEKSSKRNSSTLTDKYGFTTGNLPEGRKAEIDQALLQAIVMDQLSFSFVESPYIKRLFQLMLPNYKLPGA